jgi:hypothetical protein
VQQAGIFTGFVGLTRSTLQTDGNFTAITGDVFRMSDLFKASAPAGHTLAGFRVALGDVAPGDVGGRLWLDGKDVTARTSFAADEFAHLTYDMTGASGPQSLVVVAQTGTRLPNLPDGSLGGLTREIDSPAVQITATVNAAGIRSINAMNALVAQPDGADGVIAGIVQQAGIFTGWTGSARSTFQTDGNFTAITGDVFRMSDLFKATAPTGQALAGFRVALGDAAGDIGGKLWLDGKDVTARTSFSADEFAHLTYDTAGASGPQSLVVVAQTGTRLANLPDGSLGPLTREIDSPAVQITANVSATGSRSINAMNALVNQPDGADAVIAGIVQQAGIFTGWTGSARSTLQTDGNFSAITGDIFRMSDLFKATASTGQTLAGFRVALGDVAAGGVGGKLWLDGKDVTARTSFSADEFAHLTYDTTGASGPQSLVVVAQTGTCLPNLADGSLGPLTREIDSPAVQITANISATGNRSINAMNALVNQPDGADAVIAGIVQQAGIFTGFVGSTRSTLQTDGNFTAVTGDVFRMSNLFEASAPAGQTLAGFRVALGGVAAGGVGGKLWLDGKDVTARTSFSADEFAHLTYDTTGASGPQSLVVVAQTGTRQPNLPDGSLGALTREIDSPAVQITATVNAAGSRSINAMNALVNQPEGADGVIAGIVQQAGIFTGFVGSTRSTLQTDLTTEPPVSLSALEESTGAYRSAGSNAGGSEFDLQALYATAVGGSVLPGVYTSPGGQLATALLLLGGAATGAFQAADNLSVQALAIRAYNTTKSL